MQESIIATKKSGGGFYETAGSGNKKRILMAVSVVAALALFLAGYIFYRSVKNGQSPAEKNQEVANEATKGVLPSLSNNPLENKPNLNPVDNTNPIKEIKTNPFE